MTAALMLATAIFPTASLASTPPMGVPLQVRRGFYVEANTGTFFTVGGKKGVSNAQPFLGAVVGRDLGERVTLSLHLDVGSSAGNCFTPDQDQDTGECIDPTYVRSDPSGLSAATPVRLASNFAIFGLTAQAQFGMPLAERFSLAPKIIAGGAAITPQAVAPADRSQVGETQTFHVLGGAGIGLQYATNLDHFTVGIDVEARYLLGPNVFGIAAFPRLKYTF